MTLNGVMAVTLRYFTALFYCVPTHNRVDLWQNSCTSLLYFVVRVRCRRYESLRSLSHLLMSFLSIAVFNGGWDHRFYSASALLAMQTAVLTRPFMSVSLSVCHSVTFRCFVQTNEDTIVRYSASGATILLSGEVKFFWIFAWNHP